MEAKPTLIAAIDAGSNGIRMALAEVEPGGKFTVTAIRRAAVRLGHDSFRFGRFSPETIDAAVDAFAVFHKELSNLPVAKMRAVATSATREARNRREMISRVADVTGIKLETIGGMEEAQLVFRSVCDSLDIADETALLVDMGGGSVEVTVAQDGQTLGCETLKLGPVRLLEELRHRNLPEHEVGQLIERYRPSIRSLIDAELDGASIDVCVGVGGNVERMGKLRTQLLNKVKAGKFKTPELDVYIEKLMPMSVAKRIETLDLRTDRADVILIAIFVMKMIVEEAKVRKVLIPGVGLKDGLLRDLAMRVG